MLDGRISFVDWLGNSVADEEAREGALLHPAIDDPVQAANALRDTQRQICKYTPCVNSVVIQEQWTGLWFEDVTDPLDHGTRQPPMEEIVPGERQDNTAFASSEVDVSRVGTSSKVDVEARAPPPVVDGHVPNIRDGFDSSHLLYMTEHFLFCATCGSMSGLSQVRSSSRLYSACSGPPRADYARRMRDQLMLGNEPTRPITYTGRAATPYFAE